MQLSILIPARNEQFLAQTIENILENKQGETEVIAVCDGNWPEPPIPDHPDVTLIYHSQSIGQRAATNEAAKMSEAQFIMKCDAHCAFDEGFDVKLMAECEYNWTVIPRMYNLHGFDWQCNNCGNRTYQGPKPTKCEKCQHNDGFEIVVVWQPRKGRRTDFARFDRELHFQYWRAYETRPEADGPIADVMCSVGACWFLHRQRFWELGGLDEEHGSWGQMGVEIACKTWLSGGRQVVNKQTWFAHMFRTQPGFGFPYPNPGRQVQHARQHSRQLWLGDNWPKAQRKLQWLLDKFAPIPDWDGSKGVVFYTDNRLDRSIAGAVQGQLEKAAQGLEIISVSLEPMKLGQNIVLDAERGYLTMFKQILAGLEASTADIIFFCEHDVLYHPSHFDFIPEHNDVYYYNENVWKVRASDGHALFYYVQQTSGLCAYRELLLEHYRERVRRTEAKLAELGDSREYRNWIRRQGFEPGTHGRQERVDDYKARSWQSEYPNVDIRHEQNLTPSRWRQEQFRNKKYCRGWQEADVVPGWGKIRDRFQEVADEVEK